LPYAFTEQGVAMLSIILNSDKAVNMNIAVMRAFVEIRRLAWGSNHLSVQLQELRQRIGEHDVQLSQIYKALEICRMKKRHNKSGLAVNVSGLKQQVNRKTNFEYIEVIIVLHSCAYMMLL
jgi:hypothetical protein